MKITQKYLQQEVLDVIQCASKISNSDGFLQRRRKTLVANTVVKATGIYEEMVIAIERIIRKRMPNEEAEDAGLTLKQELRREMLVCLDSISQEVSANVDDL